MKANYLQGKLDGDFIVYFVEGGIHVQGKYINDRRDGVWNYFDEQGNLTISLVYNMGTQIQTEESAKQETEYVNKILQEDVTQDDPEKFLENPEALIYKDMGIQEPQQDQQKQSKKEKKKKRKKADILSK